MDVKVLMLPLDNQGNSGRMECQMIADKHQELLNQGWVASLMSTIEGHDEDTFRFKRTVIFKKGD